jgi:hypothetical protein
MMGRIIEEHIKLDKEGKATGGLNERASIKGPHGYIQGYTGIAVADSLTQVIGGAGVKTSMFPKCWTINGAMQELSGEDEPLKEAIVEGDRG